jgi:hypothetical protein
MHELKRFMISAAAIGLAASPAATFAIGAAAASPDSNGQTVVPATTTLRRCDHSAAQYVSARGYGTASAVISTTEPNKVVANVRIEVAQPFTQYNVRLIQMPRPSWSTCAAGSPGTTVGTLFTDVAGVGTTTVQGDIQSGATGAWVFIERPGEGSVVPSEFYTSDFVAAI